MRSACCGGLRAGRPRAERCELCSRASGARASASDRAGDAAAGVRLRCRAPCCSPAAARRSTSACRATSAALRTSGHRRAVGRPADSDRHGVLLRQQSGRPGRRRLSEPRRSDRIAAAARDLGRHRRATSPCCARCEPDVEALLVNRVARRERIRRARPDYFVVPIDECFRLVGLIRPHWKGLSGGTEVWRGDRAVLRRARRARRRRTREVRPCLI